MRCFAAPAPSDAITEPIRAKYIDANRRRLRTWHTELPMRSAGSERDVAANLDEHQRRAARQWLTVDGNAPTVAPAQRDAGADGMVDVASGIGHPAADGGTDEPAGGSDPDGGPAARRRPSHVQASEVVHVAVDRQRPRDASLDAHLVAGTRDGVAAVHARFEHRPSRFVLGCRRHR